MSSDMTPSPQPRLPWEASLDREVPRFRRPPRRATRAAAVGAPWHGRTPQSAQASYDGARAIMHGAGVGIAARYLAWLEARGDRGGTDYEASDELEIQRSTINGRRNHLITHGPAIGIEITSHGFRKGPTGVRNAVWVLRTVRPWSGTERA